MSFSLIETSSSVIVGVYPLAYTICLDHYPEVCSTSESAFTIKIVEPTVDLTEYFVETNLEPEFKDPLLTSYKLDFSQAFTSGSTGKVEQIIEIGQLIDLEDDPFEITAQFTDSTVDFASVTIAQDGTIQVEIDYDAARSSAKNATYILEVRVEQDLSDSDETINKSYQVSFEVTGIMPDEEIVFVPTFQEEEQKESEEYEPPSMSIDSVDRFGRVIVDFSESLLIPSEVSYVNETSLLL